MKANNPSHRARLATTNGWETVSGTLVLALLFVSGCLELKSHKRPPDTDAEHLNNCSGVSCWNPPHNTCSADEALQVYAPSGYCSGGKCAYATREEQCRTGLCEAGACVSTPCQGVTCIDPPEPRCEDAGRTIFSPTGHCIDGKCEYASQTSRCDQSCELGACTESPCVEVLCRKPPAPYCKDGKSLVVFEPEGRCAVEEGQPRCLYESKTIDCAHGCEDGRCEDDPCSGVICDRPPSRYCDGSFLVLFEPYGVCDERGLCSYTEQRYLCSETCVDAHCEEDDACIGVTCNEPPASHCRDDSARRVYDRSGWCEDGFCSYLQRDVSCKDGCEEGRCVDAPCEGVSCDRPPASYCTGSLRVSFAQKGTCNEGTCSYSREEHLCPDGCKNGQCLAGGDTDTIMDADTDSNPETALTWVLIAGGTFEMGTSLFARALPIHSVTVPTFEMLRTEVTVSQYKECVTAGACTEPESDTEYGNWGVAGRENHPVNNVDWNQAVSFCTWAGGRLPSEAEWEYAASNGSLEHTYPWGDATATCDYAVMDDDTQTAGCGMNRTWEVCSKPAGNTSHGLCDMAGNVWEWVRDWYHGSYDCDANPEATDCSAGGVAPDDGSAWEVPIGSNRVRRGGNFRGGGSGALIAAKRGSIFPSRQAGHLGFRCAREAP